jgi:hypothetical protein
VGSPATATVNIADNDAAVVTVTASDANASEPGADTGTFTISRTGPTTSALTVFYTPGGTATSPSDYTALAVSATILAGQASVAVTVTPVNDVVSEPSETVVLNLSANAAYSVGSPGTATVTIADDDAAVVTVDATDNTATEAGPTSGTFTITRTGSLTSALTVSYTVGGTATTGSDYTALTGSATILANQTIVTVTVTPLNDTLAEPSETVVLNLSSNAGYTIGSPSAATVNISDNDGQIAVLVGLTSKDQCKKGGWMTFGVFKNQGDCVSFVATGGKNPPANLP